MKVKIILTHVLTCIAIQCGWFINVGASEATRADTTTEVVTMLIFFVIGCGLVALDFFVCRRILSKHPLLFRWPSVHFFDLILILPLLWMLFITTVGGFDSEEILFRIALAVLDALLIADRIVLYRMSKI